MQSNQWWQAWLLSFLATGLALCFIALAAWGWHGFEPLLAEPARVGACAALVALAAATPLCGCNFNPGRRTDAANDWVLVALLFLGLLLGWASAYCDRVGWLVIDGPIIRYTGLSLFIVGCYFRIASILALGPRFVVWVAVQHHHELVTTGIYRFIRHPSYTGAMLTLIGWALTFRSLVGVLIASIMCLMLITRIDAEERLLLAEFGEAYTAYQESSWRLAPGVY